MLILLPAVICSHAAALWHPGGLLSIDIAVNGLALQVVAGQTAALALKKVKRSSLRKVNIPILKSANAWNICCTPWPSQRAHVQGMVLVDSSLHPKASWEFDADIAILTHSTTIAPKYQAVIHCEIVRQAARVVAMDRERLRSGDREPPAYALACTAGSIIVASICVTPGSIVTARPPVHLIGVHLL